ncbi:MAG: helix-turn-helix domain-containing protein [Anaerolineae bacterium]|nr:MAG: helix-turn-helix domain-containing protein [Anaerolineae bacterium]
MKEDMFDELVASVREGGKILRGKAKASRVFNLKTPDVKKIRAGFDLSQAEFATLLGVSVKTLQNWEQGRRAPEGAARVLLQVAADNPQAIWDVVKGR